MTLKSSIFPPGYTNISGAPLTPETLEILAEGDDEYIPSLDGREEYHVTTRAGIEALVEWTVAAQQTYRQLQRRTQKVESLDIDFRAKMVPLFQEASFATAYWSLIKIIGELHREKGYTVSEFPQAGSLLVLEGTEVSSPAQWVGIATQAHRRALTRINTISDFAASAGFPLESVREIEVGQARTVADAMGNPLAIAAVAVAVVVLVGVGLGGTAIVSLTMTVRPLVESLAQWMNTVNEMNDLNLEVAETTEAACQQKYAGNPEGYSQCANEALGVMIENSETLGDIGIQSFAGDLLGTARAFGTILLLGGTAVGTYLILKKD